MSCPLQSARAQTELRHRRRRQVQGLAVTKPPLVSMFRSRPLAGPLPAPGARPPVASRTSDEPPGQRPERIVE